jgi:hypothetical protein
MKKPRMVVDLLVVVDVCIEATEAQPRLLESWNKGPSEKKKEDWEVNITDRGDHGYHGNCQQQPADQKGRRSFYRRADAEQWCEIHHTAGHDLQECKTFLNHKKMPPPQAAPEPHRGEHHRANPDNEEQIDEINVIFGGSMSIASKTQGKKLERERSSWLSASS